MKALPPPPGETPRPPRRDSFLIYLPGGVPVLRAAVEELLRSGWDEVFRQRACEIACAFEGSFRSCGHADLAAVARSITLLLELSPAEIAGLGAALQEKLNDLLGQMEKRLSSDEETKMA
jgi:hypothetical protein